MMRLKQFLRLPGQHSKLLAGSTCTRHLNNTTAHISKVHPHASPEDVLKHPVLYKALKVELEPKQRTWRGNTYIVYQFGTVNFSTSEDKKEAIILANQFMSQSNLTTTMLPFGFYDENNPDPRNHFAVLHPHAPYDCVIVNNLPWDCEVDDLVALGIDFEECYVLNNKQKYIRGSINPRRFAIMYFATNTLAYEFTQLDHELGGSKLVKRLAASDRTPAMVGSAATKLRHDDKNRLLKRQRESIDESELVRDTVEMDLDWQSASDEFEKVKM